MDDAERRAEDIVARALKDGLVQPNVFKRANLAKRIAQALREAHGAGIEEAASVTEAWAVGRGDEGELATRIARSLRSRAGGGK